MSNDATAPCRSCCRSDGSFIMTNLHGRCPECHGTRRVPLCVPPEGTDDFTMHRLSREVGDGSKRQEFDALWTGGLWQTKGMQQLSPRKAAMATWEWVRNDPNV